MRKRCNQYYEYTYGITEEVYSIEKHSRKSYGIAAYSDSGDSTATFVASVHDISSDRKSLDGLVLLCNRLELSLIHLNDAVEDFLTR